MSEPVAIVGMGAVFPGAPDLDAFWSNIERGVDAVTDVPASRVDPVYFASNALPCTRGGFIDPAFDPIAFGIMPIAAASAEPDQMLALHVAAAALDDAAVSIPRDRTSVILGRGGYLTPGMARLVNRVRTTQQLVTTLGELLPDLDAETVERIRAAFQARAGELGADAIGLVPNLAASRIANRLDLRGPAYTIDAACASSLLAVDQGCRDLGDRRADLVVAGGVHVCHDVTFWSVFAQLGALSKTSQIRPFDRRADGIVIGEGAGIVVLKRLADAERDGDRIYATILGTGASSDGRESSAMRPRADGQLAAIQNAWRVADRDPQQVGLVEAHGTATPTGDEVELGALAQFFGVTTGERAAVGSVKSMIGHAMPAAGAAGLVKTALALHHGVVPPSLHCEEPNAALAATRFRVLAKAEPWGALGKLAAVSAFGFGGINAHVVVEGHSAPRRRPRTLRKPELLAVAGDSLDQLRAGLDGTAATGHMRLAMLDPTPERRALAKKVLDRGKAWRGNNDIWFAPEPLAAMGGTVAFLFPGVEATFAANTDDLQRELGIAVPEIGAASTANATSPRELEIRGQGVFALGRLLAAALRRLGVVPAAIAGHSIGEWTGMVASELIPADAIDAFVRDLPAGSLEVPDVVFAAVGCSAAGAEVALEGLADIAVSHDNCPHQSIVCGKRDSIAAAIARLGQRGVLCQELPFRSGFHSPLFGDYLGLHGRLLANLPLQRARIPLWSATTCAPYPDTDDAVRALTIDHLVKPVRFRELIDALYGSGVRAFVQLGVGSLASFVGDTLRGKDHLAIAAASGQHAGLAQLARVRAALYADGFLAELDEAVAPARPKMHLALGVPLVMLAGTVPPLTLTTSVPDAAGDPVLAELLATLDEAASASRAVVEAYRTRAEPAVPPQPSEIIIRRRISVASDPHLLDHCFYRQPPAWPSVGDRYPVVPMTMTLGMMIDAARELRPELVAIALEEVRALRWMAVEPAVEISIHAKAAGDVVEVEIPGYARATVRLAAAYPQAPAPRLTPLAQPRPAPHTARQMYDDRWMFHGPAYQGVTELGPVGDDGVDGVIETLPAPGALLDCAGQLMGWWVMRTETRDRLAMPVQLAKVELFGPHPAAGERVACGVRIRHVEPREVRADLELVQAGRVWARITGWTDRRFDSDDPVWRVLMYPETNALAEPGAGGVVTLTEHWSNAASRELMMRRYLAERERDEYDTLGPRARRGWLLGRMAVKDAVRQRRWAAGAGPIWPAEIYVDNAPSGQPIVDGVAVSIAHKDGIAVALVADQGTAVGVDLERVEPRTEAFLAVAFTDRELALGSSDEDLARMWAAKEAVAKSRGTGMTNPKAFEVTAIAGEQLTIGTVTAQTRRDGDYVIAWVKP